MNILIIDIETTNFLQRGGKIVEVGIVELNLETGEKRILFDHICHEAGLTEKEVSESWIVNNSDLTIDDIRHSFSFFNYEKQIQEIINKYPLGATAYNNKFDFDFLESRGIIIPVKLGCPMKLSTNICKLPGRMGYKWPKVEEAYNFFFPEREYVEKHRGADDALHEAEIVKELYDRGVFKINV